MSSDIVTFHAARRFQQRAIPPFLMDLLARYGASTRCDGADRLSFNKASRQRMKRDFGGDRALRVIERWLNVYAIIGDNGRIVTVGHRTKRSNRH